jgi:ribosomal-protein-alanine N-acetyltransferase
MEQGKTAVRICSERLYQRTLRDADCTTRYVNWLNDRNVNRFLETRHTLQSVQSVTEFVAAVNARRNEHLFGIFLKDADRHIGNIKVGPIGTYHPLADISLFIGDRDCWGKGYASEAIEALSRYALSALGVRKLSASMYEPNQGSVRAFLKAGYKREGLRRAHYLLEGHPCNLIELGLIPEDLG